MNLDELRAVQSKERQTDSLQHLRASFYAEASEYVSELEAARDSRASEVEDPFADPEVRRLSDEVETAREVVEAIYDRRLGKLVKRASLAAAATPTDEEGLTAEERELYDDLVALIEANKTRVLDVIDADPERDEVAADEAAAVAGAGADVEAGDSAPAPDGSSSTGQSHPSDEERSTAVDEGSGEGADASRAEAPQADPPETGVQEEHQPGDGLAEDPVESGLGGRTTVRITGDVDEFFGVDQREYDLDPETVVTLPAENAEPLLESGDAERVD